MPALALFTAIFKALMLVDSFQRFGWCCSNYWYYIILFLPFGEWIYFFMVKIHDPQIARYTKVFFTKRVSLEDLRYRAAESPSVANKTVLAQALIDSGAFTEARELLQELVKSDPTSKRTVFLFAQALLGEGDSSSAVSELERITSSDLAFDNFHPAMTLAEAYWNDSAKEKAVELLRLVANRSRRLEHSTALAKCLINLNSRDEARLLLDKGLNDFKHSPAYVKRGERPYAREAKNMLRSLGVPAR